MQLRLSGSRIITYSVELTRESTELIKCWIALILQILTNTGIRYTDKNINEWLDAYVRMDYILAYIGVAENGIRKS